MDLYILFLSLHFNVLDNSRDFHCRYVISFSRSIVNNVAELDPGSGAFLTPGSGIRIGDGKNPDPGSGSGMNTPDLIFENFIRFLG